MRRVTVPVSIVIVLGDYVHSRVVSLVHYYLTSPVVRVRILPTIVVSMLSNYQGLSILVFR